MRLASSGLIITVAATLCGGCEKSDKTNGNTGRQTGPGVQPTSVVTKENYLKIQIGMRADDLKLILGKPTSENDFYNGSLDTQDWHWKDGEKEFYVILTRKDGAWVVKDKTQYGLD